MSTHVVEVEYHDMDGDKLTELHGPFRTRKNADAFAESLGRAAGLEQVSYGWAASDGDCRFMTVMSRQLGKPLVRARATDVKRWLKDGERS